MEIRKIQNGYIVKVNGTNEIYFEFLQEVSDFVRLWTPEGNRLGHTLGELVEEARYKT